MLVGRRLDDSVYGRFSYMAIHSISPLLSLQLYIRHSAVVISFFVLTTGTNDLI